MQTSASDGPSAAIQMSGVRQAVSIRAAVIASAKRNRSWDGLGRMPASPFATVRLTMAGESALRADLAELDLRSCSFAEAHRSRHSGSGTSAVALASAGWRTGRKPAMSAESETSLARFSVMTAHLRFTAALFSLKPRSSSGVMTLRAAAVTVLTNVVNARACIVATTSSGCVIALIRRGMNGSMSGLPMTPHSADMVCTASCCTCVFVLHMSPLTAGAVATICRATCSTTSAASVFVSRSRTPRAAIWVCHFAPCTIPSSAAADSTATAAAGSPAGSESVARVSDVAALLVGRENERTGEDGEGQERPRALGAGGERLGTDEGRGHLVVGPFEVVDEQTDCGLERSTPVVHFVKELHREGSAIVLPGRDHRRKLGRVLRSRRLGLLLRLLL